MPSTSDAGRMILPENALARCDAGKLMDALAPPALLPVAAGGRTALSLLAGGVRSLNPSEVDCDCDAT